MIKEKHNIEFSAPKNDHLTMQKRAEKIKAKKQTKKIISKRKKQKYDKLFPSVKPVTFPNFLRRIVVKYENKFVFVAEIVGYLHRVEGKIARIVIEIEDPHNEFSTSYNGKSTYWPASLDFPNLIRTIHVFTSEHQCIAEIDFRGYLYLATSVNTFYTFHLSNSGSDDYKVKNYL